MIKSNLIVIIVNEWIGSQTGPTSCLMADSRPLHRSVRPEFPASTLDWASFASVTGVPTECAE